MSATLFQETFGIFDGGTLLERLALASIEVAVLAALLWVVCRLRVVKSPRLCALLWIVVLAKPLFSLTIGSPMPVVAIERPKDLGEIVLFAPQGGDLDAMIEAQFARDREHLDRIAAGRVIIPAIESDETPIAAATAPSQPAETASAATTEAGWSLATILLGLWGIGVIAMVGIITIDLLKLRRLHRRGGDAPEGLHEMADAIAHDIGLKRVPALRVIEGLDSPALVGVLRPAVFLPKWLAEESNAEQAAWLLRHELMHARHGDPVALLLRRASEALFFFHPAVWFAGRQWEEATELACDRALVANNDQARDYARQLLGVLEARQVQRPMVMSPGLFATRTQIGRRIAALLANPLRHPARLGVFSLALLALGGAATVSLGLGLNASAPADVEETTAIVEQVEWVAPPRRAQLTEAMAKNLHSRAQADLRTMHTALESYRVDFRVYPEQMRQLTTPIAYISRIPNDPFIPFAYQAKDPATGELAPHPGGGTYRMEHAPDYTELRVFSIGPDGRDQQGAVAYDLANGTFSEGDIVRSIQLEDYFDFTDNSFDANIAPMLAEGRQHSITALAIDQTARLHAAEQIVRLWAISNKKMPENWNDIIATEEGFTPPPDLFGDKSATLKYVLKDSIGIVYSVGPDRKDDGGRRIPNGRYSNANLPDGDMAREIKWEAVQKDIERLENPTAAAEEDPYLKALLAQKEKTGRDNAMIHYQLASLSSPELPMGDVDEEIRRLRGDNPWTNESNKVLLYLKAWETSFAQIRKGTALDHAENIDPAEHGHETRVPNFLMAQTASRALVAQGKYFESRGELDRALDNYLTVIRMGRDYGSENALLIGSLISVAIQSTGNSALGNLVTSGKLSEAQLDRAEQELAHIARTYPGITEGFRGETLASEAGFEKMKAEILAMTDEEFARRRGELQQQMGIGGLAQFTIRTREGLINSMGSGREEMRAYYDAVTEHTSKPPYEHPDGDKALREMVESFKHPMAKVAVPNFQEAATRDYVMQSKRDIVRVKIALERHRRYHSRYPERLEELRGRWIGELPIDPFSGELFQYHAFDDATKYVLYGYGPEKRDNPDAIAYDPTNGTLSTGVLF